MDSCAGDVENSGVLDYVTGWYFKAADYIRGTHIACAFVSTNSITQGEQVWRPLGCAISALRHQDSLCPPHIHLGKRSARQGACPRRHHRLWRVRYRQQAHLRLRHRHRQPDSSARPRTSVPILSKAQTVHSQSLHSRSATCRRWHRQQTNDDGDYLIHDPSRRRSSFESNREPRSISAVGSASDEFINRIERWCLWLGGYVRRTSCAECPKA